MARAPRSRPACGGLEHPRVWPRAVPTHRPVRPAAVARGGSSPAVARRTARLSAGPATAGTRAQAEWTISAARGPAERAAAGGPGGAALVDQLSGYAMIVAAVVMLLATLYWTARPSGL
jgi:hypothetical protein